MIEGIDYDKRITPEFVFECAKYGSVTVGPRMVTIRSNTPAGDIDLESLAIPECFRIQYIQATKSPFTNRMGAPRAGVLITLVLRD